MEIKSNSYLFPKNIQRLWLGLMVGSFLLTACSWNQTDQRKPSSEVTPLSSASTAQTPTESLILTPTAMPPLSPKVLSINNAQKIIQLGQWGKGTLKTTAWSPDMKMIAIGTTLGIHVYNVSNFHEMLFVDTGGPVDVLAFSQDGRTLASGNQNIKLWNVKTGENLEILLGEGEGYFSSLEFSLDGKTLAALRVEGSPGVFDPPSNLIVWDTMNFKTRFIIEGSGCGNGTSFTFNPDSLSMAYNMCGSIHLLSTSTGEKLPYPKIEIESMSMNFTPDGKSLLLGEYLIDIESEKITRPVRTLPGFTSSLITPDGKTLILGGIWDNTLDASVIQFLTFGTGEIRFVIQNGGVFNTHSLSPDGSLLMTIRDNQVSFWNVDSGSLVYEIPWEIPVTAITFGYYAVDGQSYRQVLVTGDQKGTVHFLDPDTNALLEEVQVSTFPIEDIDLNPDGTIIAVTTRIEDRTDLIIYNLKTARTEKSIPIRNNYDVQGNWGLSFSQDGHSIALRTSPMFKDILGWDLQTGKMITTPQHYRWKNTEDIANGPNGHIIDLDYTNNQIIDTYSGSLILQIQDAYDLEFCYEEEFHVISYDLKYFVLGCKGADIQVWDLVAQHQLSPLVGHVPYGGDGWFGNITDLAFDPFNYLLASAGYDQTIRLWNPSTGNYLKVITDLSSVVTDIDFSTDGRYLASLGRDGTIRLWGLKR